VTKKDNLSVAGALTGALAGLLAETAIEELFGIELMNGLLEVIGAGFGLIRIDKKIYQSALEVLGKVPVSEEDDYKTVVKRIDEMTEDLPELRKSFVKLVEAGLKAKHA
jgi:hypothetical protein